MDLFGFVLSRVGFTNRISNELCIPKSSQANPALHYRDVLKEHRIGSPGLDVRDTEIMRRSFRTQVCFAGSIPRVGTLGWYAMPRQGMGFETPVDIEVE